MNKFLSIVLSLLVVLVSLSSVNDYLHNLLCASNICHDEISELDRSCTAHAGSCQAESEVPDPNSSERSDCNSFTCSISVLSHANLDFINEIEIGTMLVKSGIGKKINSDKYISHELRFSNFARGPPSNFGA
tara:strand:- start:108 stop:503 length:396 start_codon:yes stop_codon:yes gene_type:complete